MACRVLDVFGGDFLPRTFEIILSVMISLPISFVIVVLMPICWISQGRPIFFWSERVGKNGHIFLMPKLRSMVDDAPLLSTNEISDRHEDYITPLGRILRKYSIDELPQIFLVLSGSMALIGPRPSLPSQASLNDLRKRSGVERLRPGITGLAQVVARDRASDSTKHRLDLLYAKNKTFLLDLKILWITGWGVLSKKNVKY